MNGVFLFLMFTFYVYSYSIASVLMEKKVVNVSTGNPYTIGDVIGVSQAAIQAIMTLGGIIPILPTIIRARICARKVFDVIERQPLISTSQDSKELITLQNSIQFKNISFRYPTQVEKTRDIFQNASFEIKAG